MLKARTGKFLNKLSDNPKDVEIGINNGVFDDKTNDFMYNKAPCETVLKGEKINAYIVFGRDRPSDWESGYGGAGHEKACAIDIVVGRVSGFDASTLPSGSYVNPSIGADAARIYLSQKADIDRYYSIADGRTPLASIEKSAIAVKADDVRIIARNTLKLVTGTDYLLSVDEPVYSSTGIQLIANNDDSDMQPIPKGSNLIIALDNIIERISQLNGIVAGFMQIQSEFNDEIKNHVHLSPFHAKPTSQSETLLKKGKQTSMQMYVKVNQGLKAHKAKLAITKQSFIIGDKTINSDYNFTN